MEPNCNDTLHVLCNCDIFLKNPYHIGSKIVFKGIFAFVK